MKISSVLANSSVKLLSGLANNDDCLAAMAVKDWIGDGATVWTYKKSGGKDDAREKAIEEFGTGAVWLFGIPAVKKIIEKLIYPIFKLNPDFDPRILDDKERLKTIKQLASGSEKELFETLDDMNPVLKKFSNAKMYKGFAAAKFLVATALSAFALTKIIKYKQKTTTDRIEKEAKEKNRASNLALLGAKVDKNKTFEVFCSQKPNNQPSFKGNLAEFMYNPIKNTMILDGVIATTRLKEARKKERFEVLFKEVCQIAFVYGLAKPIQSVFESLGKKMATPVKLDPKVLFTKDLGQKIEASKDAIKQLNNSKDILKSITELDIKNPLISLLESEGVIALTKDKTAISMLKPIDEGSIKNALKNLEEMDENINNLKGSKIFKIVAVFANILITAGIMGVIQPKLTILLRKVLYGTKQNPAIASQEEQAKLNN